MLEDSRKSQQAGDEEKGKAEPKAEAKAKRRAECAAGHRLQASGFSSKVGSLALTATLQ